MPTAFVETIGAISRIAIICGLVGMSACFDARDPESLSFACADSAPCAEGYYCSPVLGYCVLLDDSIPCAIAADCPDDGSWRCDAATSLCAQDPNP